MPANFLPKKNLDPTITSIFNSQPKSAKMVMDYDSDSTEGDYTETNVLLGYASKDADEDTISKLGGLPVRTNPSPRCLVRISFHQSNLTLPGRTG